MADIQAVIFDLDGTLANTLPDVHASINFALETLNRPILNDAQIREAIGPGKDHFIQAAMPGATEAQGVEFLEIFRGRYETHCLNKTRLFHGMETVLKAISGLKLGVASNKPTHFSTQILEGLGVKGRFDFIAGPDNVTHAKPDPEMINLVLDRLDVPSENALFVGDTDHDVMAGKGAGVNVCAVRYGYGLVEKMEVHHPEFWIDEPLELLEILDKTHK